MRIHANARNHERGLTLVEILVAVAILAVAAVVALSIYDLSRKSFKQGENKTEQQQAVRIAFDMMAADLRMTGFNYNPDGDKNRPDEQIEGAFDRAVVIRADFDAEDATAAATPETTLAGGATLTVSTGNDEILAYVLAKPDGSSSDTLSFAADVKDSPRDAVVETVNIPNVALTHDDPPYTLYRITLNNDTGTWGSSSFFTRTPLIENVYSMDFAYHSVTGVNITAPGGADTAAAIATRKSITRIGLELIGLTPDPDLNWTDSDDPYAATKSYRKFELTSDITPRNIGMVGVKDILADVTPPGKPATPTLVPGHCGGLYISWTANPVSDNVAYYRINYGTVSGSPSANRNSGSLSYYLAGLSDATAHYVTIQAVDDAGNISVPSNEASSTTTNVNTPLAPDGLTATTDLNGAVDLNWTAVSDNSASVPAGDPAAPMIRDLKGYRVYRDTNASFNDASLIADESIVGSQATPSYPDTNVVNCRSFHYWVTAVDACGVESAASSSTTGYGTTNRAPKAPLNL